MDSIPVLRAGRAAALASIALSIGCATYDAPTMGSLRADYARAAPTREAEARDTRTLAAPELGRCAFVAAVLDRNPSVDAAREAWRAAIAHARSTGAVPDPSVSVEIAPLSIGSSNVPFGLRVAFSQRLPWPEKLALDDAVAKNEALASEQDYAGVRRALALAAAVLYDDYFVAVRSIETNQRHVTIQKDLKRAALAALEAGRASAQDPIAAETALAHLEHAAMVYAADREVIVAQMNALLHRDPSAALPPPVKSLVVPRGVTRQVPVPEIAAETIRARAERDRAARWRRDWVPDLTLMTSYDTMWAMPEHQWMVGVGLTLPIELGHRAAAAEAAEAEAARHDDQARAFTDKANAALAVSRTRFTEARHVDEIYRERIVPFARAELDAARSAFEASRNDFTTVLAAERELWSVELASYEKSADVDRKRAELDDALGAVACAEVRP